MSGAQSSLKPVASRYLTVAPSACFEMTRRDILVPVIVPFVPRSVQYSPGMRRICTVKLQHNRAVVNFTANPAEERSRLVRVDRNQFIAVGLARRHESMDVEP